MKKINKVKTPEVGDVWKYADETLHFSEFGKKQGWSDIKEEDCVLACHINSKGYVESNWYKLRILMKTAKYIGKSKAGVKDLFEVDNTTSTDIIDRNIRKENMRLQAEINRLREALKSQIKALVALKGFYPETYLFADDNIRRIKEALNEESEEK